MSLDSRIKKHVHARPHSLMVFHPRGFDAVCADEIKEALSELAMPDRFGPEVTRTASGIRVENIQYRSIVELGLRLRTARDIYWILESGRAASVDEVKRRALKIPWELILSEGAKVAVRTALRGSRLRHEGLVKKSVAEALAERGISVVNKAPSEVLDVRLENNRLQLALAFSAEPLFHRGYKKELRGAASIKEDLAACLIRSAWNENGSKPERIFCPFAGSGTLGFEALLALRPIPASFFRDDLSFLNWLPSRGSSAAYVTRSLIQRAATSRPAGALFWERSAKAATDLASNARGFASFCRRKGIDLGELNVKEADFFSDDGAAELEGSVFIPLNPPYGRRLKSGIPPVELYRAAGARLERLASSPSGLIPSGFILAPNKSCESAFRAELRSYRTRAGECLHGGKTVRVLYYVRRGT